MATMQIYATSGVRVLEEVPLSEDGRKPVRNGEVRLSFEADDYGGGTLWFGTAELCRWARVPLGMTWAQAMDGWAKADGVMLATVNGEQVWPLPWEDQQA